MINPIPILTELWPFYIFYIPLYIALSGFVPATSWFFSRCGADVDGPLRVRYIRIYKTVFFQ